MRFEKEDYIRIECKFYRKLEYILNFIVFMKCGEYTY